MNKKGFTLVELLATITIMLIIASIAIPTGIKFIQRADKKQYEILEKQIVSAASKYYVNNKNEKCIELDKLKNNIDEKYLNEAGDVINPNNNKVLNKKVKVNTTGNKTTYELVNSCT